MGLRMLMGAALFAALPLLASCSDGAGADVVVATVTPASAPAGSGSGNSATSPPAAESPTAPATPTVPAGPAGALLPCGDILVPINKQNRLAADCVPPDLEALPEAISEGGQSLRREAAEALREMFQAAQKDGFRLLVNSSYRDYGYQASLFDGYVRSQGLAHAERTSARPGHSEHQLGTTADIGAPGRFLEAFEGTPEAAWVAGNSWKYGFIVSYPDGKEPITGYAYEPWHVRYVGRDVARRVHDGGKTLHEFLLQR